MYGRPVGSDYVEHLTDKDLEVLAAAAGVPARPSELRAAPGQVPALFDRPEVFFAVLAPGREPVLTVTPFMVFAAVVHRAAADLASASHVVERAGARDKVPVFDGPQLAAFLESQARRLFLAELLASFARVASGHYRVRTANGWRAVRFNELDPVQLCGLIDSIRAEERPGAYRRLGDVALFLTGVFPDYARKRSLGPFDAARLRRAAGLGPEGEGDLVEGSAIELFEQLGVRWYRQACELAPTHSARLAVVDEVAARFRQARRALNFMADRYLFPAGNPWFA